MSEITNQPPPLEPYDLFASDTVLREAVVRERAAWAQAELGALGRRLGEPDTIRLGPQPRSVDIRFLRLVLRHRAEGLEPAESKYDG